VQLEELYEETTKAEDFALVSDSDIDDFLDSTAVQQGRIECGFEDIDRRINGFYPGDVTVIAARPGMGKTAFGLQIASYIQKTEPVAFISLEMQVKAINARMIARTSLVPLNVVRNKTFDHTQFLKIKDAIKEIKTQRIWIQTTQESNVSALRTQIMKLKADHGVGTVFIDYLQLMKANNKHGRYEEVSEISREIKTMALQLEVKVFLLAQLSRAGEQRQNKRPILSDLRDSGAIEQDANNVIFIHRVGQQTNDYQDTACELVIAKAREGSQGICEAEFIGEMGLFCDKDVF